jgi:hypothetical protein
MRAGGRRELDPLLSRALAHLLVPLLPIPVPLRGREAHHLLVMRLPLFLRHELATHAAPETKLLIRLLLPCRPAPGLLACLQIGGTGP